MVIVLIIAALYVFITTRWNKTLKKQVAIHTRRLESANQILEQKITEEKRTRLQLVHKEKMHSLGQLVAGIAHEIRNPLTSIQAFVELIPNKYENRQFREEVSTFVPQEINRLNTLLNHLLDYAKPQEPRKEIFSLERCFNSVLTLFQLQLDQRRIIFKKNVNAEHFVYADYGQIKQVLVNVLLNAMEAIEAEGEITITSHKNQDQVYLQIDDNGVGIDEDQLKMVFETFYTNKKAGTGLGLSLSLQYMKENNGDLWIESEKDQGTKVTLVLPEGGEANEPPSTVDH